MYSSAPIEQGEAGPDRVEVGSERRPESVDVGDLALQGAGETGRGALVADRAQVGIEAMGPEQVDTRIA